MADPSSAGPPINLHPIRRDRSGSRWALNAVLTKGCDTSVVDFLVPRGAHMATAAFENGRLVISDGAGDSSAGLDLQALSPILIGFMSPFVALLLVNPSALQHVRFMAVLVLILVFVLAAIVFVHSAMTPGRTTTASFDREARLAHLTRRGAFASRTRTIPFQEIKAVEITKTYDDDGYSTEHPELHLATGEAIALPADSGAAEIAAVRRAIGLA